MRRERTIVVKSKRCLSPGCDRDATTRGNCLACYQHLKRHMKTKKNPDGKWTEAQLYAARLLDPPYGDKAAVILQIIERATLQAAG